jgi:hypothetical protein
MFPGPLRNQDKPESMKPTPKPKGLTRKVFARTWCARTSGSNLVLDSREDVAKGHAKIQQLAATPAMVSADLAGAERQNPIKKARQQIAARVPPHSAEAEANANRRRPTRLSFMLDRYGGAHQARVHIRADARWASRSARAPAADWLSCRMAHRNAQATVFSAQKDVSHIEARAFHVQNASRQSGHRLGTETARNVGHRLVDQYGAGGNATRKREREQVQRLQGISRVLI